MAARNIKLDLDKGFGTIHVDGQRVRGVRGIHLISKVGGVVRVVLDLVIHEMEVDAKAEVVVPDKTVATLIALGWTPPSED